VFRDGDGDIDGVLNYVLNLNFVVDSVRDLDIVNDSIVNFVVGCVRVSSNDSDSAVNSISEEGDSVRHLVGNIISDRFINPDATCNAISFVLSRCTCEPLSCPFQRPLRSRRRDEPPLQGAGVHGHARPLSALE